VLRISRLYSKSFIATAKVVVFRVWGRPMRLLVVAVYAGTLVLAAAAASFGATVSAIGALAPAVQGGPFPGVSTDAPPKVLSTTPTDGSTAVSVSARIGICFSATMNRTATENGFSYSDGSYLLGSANGTFSWRNQSLVDDCLAFNPDENFRVTATYALRLDASVVQDANGSLLDGDGDGTPEGSPSDDYRWNFTVEIEDETLPVVVATDPPDNTGDVAVTASLTITFSESMNTTSVAQALLFTDGRTTLTAANGTEEWTRGDEVYAFTPAESLAEGVVYRVSLNGSSARDRSGNLLDGNGNGTGGDNHTFSFSTAAPLDTTPPVIEASDPPDGKTRVSRRPVITIIFSEAMDRQSVEDAVTVSSGASPFRFAWPNPEVVNFTSVSPLAYKTAYVVSVASAAMDLAGNRLPGSYSFLFTTTPWIGTANGSAVERGRPIANASVALNDRETLTSASGTFAFEGVEQGTYVLNISEEGYEPYSEVVTIDEADHDLGAIPLRELPIDPGPLPWALVGAVAASAVLLFVLLRRRPKLEEAPPDDWRPTEAVAVPPEEEPPKP